MFEHFPLGELGFEDLVLSALGAHDDGESSRVERKRDAERGARILDASNRDEKVLVRIRCHENETRNAGLDFLRPLAGKRRAIIPNGETLRRFFVALPSGGYLTEFFATPSEVEHGARRRFEALALLEAITSRDPVSPLHGFASGSKERLRGRCVRREGDLRHAHQRTENERAKCKNTKPERKKNCHVRIDGQTYHRRRRDEVQEEEWAQQRPADVVTPCRFEGMGSERRAEL